MGGDGAIVFRSEASFEARGPVRAVTVVDDEDDDEDDREDGSGDDDLNVREGQIHLVLLRGRPQRQTLDGEGFFGGGPTGTIMGFAMGGRWLELTAGAKKRFTVRSSDFAVRDCRFLHY